MPFLLFICWSFISFFTYFTFIFLSYTKLLPYKNVIQAHRLSLIKILLLYFLPFQLWKPLKFQDHLFLTTLKTAQKNLSSFARYNLTLQTYFILLTLNNKNNFDVSITHENFFFTFILYYKTFLIIFKHLNFLKSIKLFFSQIFIYIHIHPLRIFTKQNILFLLFYFLNNYVTPIKNNISNTSHLNLFILKTTKLFAVQNISPFKYSIHLSNQKYKKIVNLIKNNLDSLVKDLFLTKKVEFFAIFKKKIFTAWPTRFFSHDLTKHLFLQFSTIYYIRKHSLFNKGRYSRNRQIYRTGAYWSIWVNIIAVYGFYFWFYRLTMNFGYLWWALYIFFFSFFFLTAFRYNLFNINKLIYHVYKLFAWYFLILQTLVKHLSHMLFNFKNLFKYTTLLLSFEILLRLYSPVNYFLPLAWIKNEHKKFYIFYWMSIFTK